MNRREILYAGSIAHLTVGSLSAVAEEGTVKTFWVAPTMRDGVGVGPMTCLQIKYAPDADWQMFYSAIRGFDYVPGFEYELKVRVTERKHVPADASKYIYTLEDVVSKTPAGLSLEHTAWQLKSYGSADGKMVPVVPKSESFLNVEEGKVSGNAGANNFSGGAEIDGTAIRFSATGSTMMMGTPELMAQENQFLKQLEAVRMYQIVGRELRLQNESSRPVLIFVPRNQPKLIGGTWEAVGINNGKGGVVSLISGSRVHAVFNEEGMVSGSSGCNSYSGAFELKDRHIQIGPLAGSRKVCAEPAGVMDQELNYLKALGKAKTYSLNGNMLELRDASGALQVKFKIGSKQGE